MDTFTPRVGAPSKFTDDRKVRIYDALLRGASRKLAAQYGGVCFDTLNEWRLRGEEEGEGEYYEFSESLKKAEAECAFRALTRIESAGISTWQAAAWLLERRYREDYGRQIVEHVGKDDKPIQMEQDIKTTLTVQNIDQRINEILGKTL